MSFRRLCKSHFSSTRNHIYHIGYFANTFEWISTLKMNHYLVCLYFTMLYLYIFIYGLWPEIKLFLFLMSVYCLRHPR